MTCVTPEAPAAPYSRPMKPELFVRVVVDSVIGAPFAGAVYVGILEQVCRLYKGIYNSFNIHKHV
jgi:hypothetical protein